MLTTHEKMDYDIKTIAKIVKEKLKEKYPKSIFSVRIERYSMGQSLHINLMKSDIKVIQDFDKIPEKALYRYVNYGHTTHEGIKRKQTEKYHQLSPNIREEYNSEHWCNGVFLTKEGHDIFRDVVKFSDEYNWNNSDPSTDYFDVHFYLHISIGKWDKPYEGE